jgi:murein DD-endopeptidase MepM/ murein hydrolase activator NlpD
MFPRATIRLDGLTVFGVSLFVFMAFNLIRDAGEFGMDGAMEDAFTGAAVAPAPDISADPVEVGEAPEAASAGGEGAAEAEEAEPAGPEPEAEERDLGDPAEVAAPYKKYRVTQGPHGFSYGHMAVDLAAGKGKKIFAPINGEVTGLYVDEYGNPTLEIENEVYFVTMLHGDYTVEEGDQVRIGDVVGRESNKGYTTNMNGDLCWGREGCGYHTHLNIYDKQAGSNVDPLDLIGD